MKLAFAAGTLTLMIIAGTASTPAAAEGWRRGYSHSGYGHHYAPHFRGRGYGFAQRGYGGGYARDGGYAPRYRGYAGGYGGYRPSYIHHGYSHGAAYTAGFNRGAESQWLVNMHARWRYDYAQWRQLYGPTGIFAGIGAYEYGHGFGYGLGHRFGAGHGYAGGYGRGCNC